MKIFLAGIGLAFLAFFLPLKAIEPVARVLVPAIALMATGIFPCMTLTVGAMKAEGRTPALVEDLYHQLRTLMMVLVVTFALAVATVVLLAATVAVSSLAVQPGQPLTESHYISIASHGGAAGSAFLLSLLAGRIVALGRAFFAVLDINRKQSLLVARAKVRGERDGALTTAKAARFAADDEDVRSLRRANDQH